MGAGGGDFIKHARHMIYGYLRVSTDEQDVQSQRLGVDDFARKNNYDIDEYITDEGVSGGKDPSKRNLGPLLKKLKSGDIIIASEISRLGRDLYMVMDILHHCMKTGCTIYTVKDKFKLGDDIQSKVLAFAFGLSAEIERQMIQMRTREGIRRRVLEGVLVGRPIGKTTHVDRHKLKPYLEEIKQAYEWGAPIRRIAEKIGADRNALKRFMVSTGLIKQNETSERLWQAQTVKNREKKRSERETPGYKDDSEFCIVELPRQRMIELIESNKTLPEIAKELPQYTYEQLYDSVLTDYELSNLYRQYGHKKLVTTKRIR